MPNWSAMPAVDVLTHDPMGTSYNAVPMGESLHRETARARMHSAGRKPAATTAPLFGSASPAGTGGHAGVPSLKKSTESGTGKSSSSKQLLPPQLRRPNISTEDSHAMGVSKRSKVRE